MLSRISTPLFRENLCGNKERMILEKSENKRENAFFSVPPFCLLLTRLVLRLLLRQ